MSKLTVEKRDEILIQLKTVIVGMEGTEDRGMAGDISEIKREIKKQNGKITKNRIMIFSLAAFLAGAGILEWADVIHIVG